MERKKRICSRVLICILSGIVFSSCIAADQYDISTRKDNSSGSETDHGGMSDTVDNGHEATEDDNGCGEGYATIRFNNVEATTKAADPDESLLSDVNIVIVDESGKIERVDYIGNVGDGKCRVKLVSGRKYSLYVCGNFGYKLPIKKMSQLQTLCCYLAYPDDYRKGIPMSGHAYDIEAGEDISIDLTRLMSKILLRMDRSRLDADVDIKVTSVKIGNCPKICPVFSEEFNFRPAVDEDWFFASGFSRKDEECSPLNIGDKGRSGAVVLYMFENYEYNSSWIELNMDYRSSTLFSGDGGLKYRFRTGGENSRIERNCCYNVTVRPAGDGLGKEGWSIDKESLSQNTRFSMKPDGYLEVDVGDRINVRCDFYPETAPFEINRDNLENDRETGIYKYAIDKDGHGVTLDITGYGVGMVYMEAGPPINDAGLLYIHVRDDR